MPRYKPLKVIPTAYNFSSFGDEDTNIENMLSEEEDALEDYNLEQAMVGMLKSMPNDRYRVLFLLQILRKDGYRLPHESLYKHVFRVHRSWYFRMIKRMKVYVDKLYHTS